MRGVSILFSLLFQDLSMCALLCGYIRNKQYQLSILATTKLFTIIRKKNKLNKLKLINCGPTVKI